MKPHINKAAALLLLASPVAADSVTRARYLMGTVCEITAYGPVARPAAAAAFDEIARLEKMLTLFNEKSELSELNRRAPLSPAPASIEIYRMIRIADEVYRASGGAFDPTARKNLPAPGLKHVKVTREPVTVSFARQDVRIDPGGIGKGFALDAAAELLRKAATTGAFINFGGQVMALGTPPGLDGWDVPIAGTPIVLRVKDASVSTSDQKEKKGHILDPRTGKPVGKRGSVTVVMKEGARADAWSTALFVLGVAKAPADLHGCALEFDGAGKQVAMAGDCVPYIPSLRPKIKKKKAEALPIANENEKETE